MVVALLVLAAARLGLPLAEQPLVPEAWMTRSNKGIEASVQGSGGAAAARAAEKRGFAPKQSRPGRSRGRR